MRILVLMSLICSAGCALPTTTTETSADSLGAGQSPEAGALGKSDAGDEQSPTPWASVARDIECEGHRVVGAALDELYTLSDPNTVTTMTEAAYRIDRISRLFEACADPRGLFPTVYRVITTDAVMAVRAGALENTHWAEAFIVDFAQTYLHNLQAELEGERPHWAWQHYYQLAANPEVSVTRTAMVGVIAHLVHDLPHTLVAIDTQEEHREDYFLFGELLFDATDSIIEELDLHYGADAEDLLHGFFLGRWIDGSLGDGATVSFSFQAVRTKAWNNRWYLQRSWMAWVAHSEIYTSYWTMTGLLGTLDGAGTI